MLTASVALCDWAKAQELEALDGDAMMAADPFVAEPQAGDLLLHGVGAPATAYPGAAGFHEDVVPAVRPVNWISGPYLRSGVNFVLGSSIFDVEQEVGYGISGGWRQPLGPEIGGRRFFFDLGGSYQEARGSATPVAIDGRRTTTVEDIDDPDANPFISQTIQAGAVQTTLEELRRGSAHAAIGWFWGPGVDNPAWDTQLRFATRVGGRVGHVRGGFLEESPEIPPAEFGGFRTTVETEPVFYKQTDTYGGLFVGTEAILLQRQYSFGQFQWTVDGEFANDWINIGDVWDGSLGTASVMMGFMLSR